MLRKLISALKAAVAMMFRAFEWVWDNGWRLVLSPLRGLIGGPGTQPCEVPDIQVEDQLTEILDDEMALVHEMSPAKLAAVEAEREVPAVEPEKAEPVRMPEPSQMTPSQKRWADRIALHTMQREDDERQRGKAIRQAMLARDLTGLPEEERAALEGLDAFEWDDLVREEDGLAIAKQVDAHVRGYAQLQALHARLEREGKLDQPPEPRTAFGM